MGEESNKDNVRVSENSISKGNFDAYVSKGDNVDTIDKTSSISNAPRVSNTSKASNTSKIPNTSKASNTSKISNTSRLSSISDTSSNNKIRPPQPIQHKSKYVKKGIFFRFYLSFSNVSFIFVKSSRWLLRRALLFFKHLLVKSKGVSYNFIDVEDMLKIENRCYVIDLRKRDDFFRATVAGSKNLVSINVPFDSIMSRRDVLVRLTGKKVILCGYKELHERRAQNIFMSMGFKNIDYFILRGGYGSYRKKMYEL